MAPRRRSAPGNLSSAAAAPLTARLLLGGALGALGGWYVAFICWGPALPVSHDELNFLFEALRLPAQGRLTDYAHAPFFYELIAVLEGLWYVFLRAVGSVASSRDFLVDLLSNQSSHLRLIRTLVALGALGMVVQVYRLGRLFGEGIPASLAALFCAGNFTFIVMTSMAKEDVFLWFFTLVAMERAWTASTSGRLRDAVIAGVAIGFAFSSKYLGVFAGLAAALPVVRLFPRIDKDSLRTSGVIVACAALSGLAAFPFIVTDAQGVFKSVGGLQSGYSAMGSKLALGAYFSHHLPNLLGWPMLIIGAAEFLRRWLKEPNGPILMSLVPVAGLLFLSLRRGFSLAYYAMPMAILLVILAVSGAAQIRDARWRKVLFAILIISFSTGNSSFAGALKHAILLTGPDTRLVAEAALNARARPGERVLLNQGVLGENVFGPPLLSEVAAEGHGPFTAARAEAESRRIGPRYRLTVINYTQDIPSDAASRYDWLVIGRRGASSVIEFGSDSPLEIGRATIPPGFRLVETIQAFPEEHSHCYPFPTTLDYEAIRNASFTSLWKKRAMGMTFDVYERLDR